jgi:hypothetical protein
MTRAILLFVTTAVLAGPVMCSAPALAQDPAAAAEGMTAAGNLPPYSPVIDPANFVANVTNPYFPLKPGTVFIFNGKRDDSPRRTEMTVTDETKMIMGVPCIVVRDVVTTNSELVEKTVDWYAQDVDGNVWYFGEDTAEYKNGTVTSTDGTWMAGVDGALPGYVMKAKPAVGDGYRQEYRPGVAEDFARVVDLNASKEGPVDQYDNILVTEDTDLLDSSKFEHKYYAPGVGFVGSDGIVNGHHDFMKITKILTAN